jgi:hypothetical protein
VRRADHSFRGVPLSLMCLAECDCEASIATRGYCAMYEKIKLKGMLVYIENRLRYFFPFFIPRQPYEPRPPHC